MEGKCLRVVEPAPYPRKTKLAISPARLPRRYAFLFCRVLRPVQSFLDVAGLSAVHRPVGGEK